jgi:hypothetical protein
MGHVEVQSEASCGYTVSDISIMSPKSSDCSPILTVGHLSLIFPSQFVDSMPLQGSRLVHPVQPGLDIHATTFVLLWQRGESGMWNIPVDRDVVERSWMCHSSILLLWVLPERLSTAILCTLPAAVSRASLRSFESAELTGSLLHDVKVV